MTADQGTARRTLAFRSGGLEPSGAHRPAQGGQLSFVFAHGYPGTNTNEETALALAELGYGTFIFRYRGAFGAPGRYSLRGSAEDIIAALHAVRAAAAGPVGLLGYSAGGMHSARVVARHPELASAVVFLAAVSDPRATRAELEAAGSGGLEAFVRTGAGVLRGDPERWLEEWNATADEPSPLEFAPRLTLPALVIHGRRDRLLPFAHAQRLFDALPTRQPPSKALVELDSDHDLAGQGAIIASAIHDFVRADQVVRVQR